MKVHVDCMTSQKLVRLPGTCSSGGPGSGPWEQLSETLVWWGMAEGPPLPWTAQRGRPESWSL